MVKYEKLLPQPDLDTEEFWEGCKRHELLVQRCKECGMYRFPPRPMCHSCNGTEVEWVKVSGKGKVYSWIVVRESPSRPVQPGFAGDRPYAVVLVEIPDAAGIRILSNIVDCGIEDIKPDMPLEIVFDDISDEVSLPKFRPVTTELLS